MNGQEIQVIIASGPAEPKRLMLGLSMAASAASAGTKVRLFLTMDGARCLSADVCHAQMLDGYPPVAELLAAIHESGGVVEYCPHCMPEGCSELLARPVEAAGPCRCAGVPAGLSSYGVRLADYPTVVF